MNILNRSKRNCGGVQVEYVILAVILIPIFVWAGQALLSSGESRGNKAKEGGSTYLMGKCPVDPPDASCL